MNQFAFIPTVPYQQTFCNGQPQPNMQTPFSNTCVSNNSQWSHLNQECPINSNQWLPSNVQYPVNNTNQWLPPTWQSPMETNQWMSQPPNIRVNCLPLCGEGVALPVRGAEGQIKFYFIPKTNCGALSSCNCTNKPIGCQNCHPEAGWLITTLLPTVQDFTNANGFWNSNFNNFGQAIGLCNTEPKPGILLFHNDVTTSTTDLHYYFPKLRDCYWIPAVDESVQAEMKTHSATQCLIQNSTQTSEADNPATSIMEEDFCDCLSDDERRGKKNKSHEHIKSCSFRDNLLRFTPKKKTGYKGG